MENVPTTVHTNVAAMSDDNECVSQTYTQRLAPEREAQYMPATHERMQSQYVDSRYVQQNPVAHVPYQPFSNVKEIMAALPEFNPLSSTSINTTRYVQRVQLLKDAYGWNDRMVVFACQASLKGPAKQWSDSLNEVFTTWHQFSAKLERDFPCTVDEADIDIQLDATRRECSESPVEYYYTMLAIGRTGNLSDLSIIKHIINGINVENLKRHISRNYADCNALLSEYFDIRTLQHSKKVTVRCTTEVTSAAN